MGDHSSIEWTDATDNIIVVVNEQQERHGWWCRKISPGCAHCYAETVNDNDYFKGNHLPYSGQPPVLKLREDIIAKWQRATKPRKRFVMSMSDMFGEWVPRAWIFTTLDGMAAAPAQTFQVLTKRADVMRREVLTWLAARGLTTVPRNIWLGVSVEDKKHGLPRIGLVRDLPAIIFLSVEPLLEDLGTVDLSGIAWVICGGESGKKARPMHPDWPRSLRDQCTTAGVPFFFKQWGEWVDGEQSASHAPHDRDHETIHNWHNADGAVEAFSLRVGKKKAGRLLDGQTWSEFPAEVA